VLEAMKMEHAVHAAAPGTVTSVTVAEGDQVETGRVLVVVEADADPGSPDSPGSPGSRDSPGSPAGTASTGTTGNGTTRTASDPA